MRRAAKTDTNQAAIVAGLRQRGIKVQPLHQVGRGVPDLLVGVRGELHLIEIKMPGEKLTGAEPAWHSEWAGLPVHVCYSLADCLTALRL